MPANPNGPRADPKIFATPSQSRALLASDAVRWLDAVLDDETRTRGFTLHAPPFVLIRLTVTVVLETQE